MDNYNLEVGVQYNSRAGSFRATVQEITNLFVVYTTASGEHKVKTRADFVSFYNVPERAFIPRNGATYFYISGTGSIEETEYDEDDDEDTESVAFGNYFRTRADAEIVRVQITPIFSGANHG